MVAAKAEQEVTNLSNERLRSWPRLSGKRLKFHEVTNGWSCKGYAVPKGKQVVEDSPDFYQGTTVQTAWESKDGDNYQWEQVEIAGFILLRVFKGVGIGESYGNGELSEAYKCRLVPSTTSNGLTWQLENIMPEDTEGQLRRPDYPYKGALLLPLASVGQGRRYRNQAE